MKRLRSQLYPSVRTQSWLAWGLLLLLILCYALWMGHQVLLRYDVFKATAFDLGNYDQAVWNTLHGRFFQFTNHGSNWYGTPIRLAQHVEPILLLLSLLYLPHADPRILLTFQTLALTSGALPTFLLTRKYLPNWPLLAPSMAAAYLFAPAVIGENIYDFHALSLATPLLLYAVLALTYRRYGWFILACVLTAACKEDMPLVVGLFGLLVIWKYKLPRLGVLLFIFGCLWTLLAFVVITPYFNTGGHHNTFWYRYAALGDSPEAAVLNILLHPWLPFTLFFTWDRIYYLFSLLRSTGFLALLAPEWLIPTLPSLAINLLSSEPYQHSGVYHYNAAIVPFVILAALHGFRRLTLLWYSWRGETTEQEQAHEEHILTIAARTRAVPHPFPGQARLQTLWQELIKRLQALRNRLTARPLLSRTLAQGRATLSKQGRSMQARFSALARCVPVAQLQWICITWIIGMIALNYFIAMPLFNIFWADHTPSSREQVIQQLVDKIPPDAAVSAGGNINPHLSERQFVTVFPELTVSTMEPGVTKPVGYVIVDLKNVSPEDKSRSDRFLQVLNQIQWSHQFRTLARADGVILLVRNNP